MTIYTFYRITHKDYGNLYVGSTKHLHIRKRGHKSDLNNVNSRNYNIQLYKFIRDNNIQFEDFIFEVLDEFDCNDNEMRFKWEQIFIDQFENILNGINAIFDKKQYFKDYEKQEKRKQYKKEYKKTDKFKEYIKQYAKSENRKQYIKEYHKTDKYKEYKKEYNKQYQKEYTKQNKDKIKQQKKEYYENNKQEISKKIHCDICNKEMSRNSLYSHKKTIHKNKIDN